MKYLSIIIPTYNRPQMLRNALLSIRTLHKDKVEIIVCDDKSLNNNKNKNKEICKQISEELGIEIIYLENTRTKGVSGARNSAVEKSKGEWLLFLDDDDELVEGYLDFVVDTVLRKVSFDFAWSDIFLRESYGQNKLLKKRFILNNEADLNNRVLTIGISYGVFMRKLVFQRCGGFDESYPVGEDTELILNLLSRKYSFCHFNQFGVIKNENRNDLLSHDFSKYANNHIIKRLLIRYSKYFEKDVSLYCAFLKRGNYIYLKEQKKITNTMFNLHFIVRHKNRIKVMREAVWKLK